MWYPEYEIWNTEYGISNVGYTECENWNLESGKCYVIDPLVEGFINKNFINNLYFKNIVT